jgi:uncharacterized membrane protein
LLSFVLSALSVLCPAPIKEQPPAGYVAPPMSMSEQELSRQQARQERIGEVGKVPERTENTYTPESQSTPSASETLREATVSPAKDVIVNASRDLDAKQNGRSPVWVFAAVMLILGLGVAFAFRQWAEKNVPMPQSKGKKQVW